MTATIQDEIAILDEEAVGDETMAMAAQAALAKVAYAGLLLDLLKMPKQTLADESLKNVTATSSIARITARNAIRAELRALVGDDLL